MIAINSNSLESHMPYNTKRKHAYDGQATARNGSDSAVCWVFCTKLFSNFVWLEWLWAFFFGKTFSPDALLFLQLLTQVRDFSVFSIFIPYASIWINLINYSIRHKIFFARKERKKYSSSYSTFNVLSMLFDFFKCDIFHRTNQRQEFCLVEK